MATEQSRGRLNPDCNTPRCHPTLNALKQLNCTSALLQKHHNTLPKEKKNPSHAQLSFPIKLPHGEHTPHFLMEKEHTDVPLYTP